MEPEYELGGILVNAHRWWQNGDHPKDEHTYPSLNEGKFVRRYRHPEVEGTKSCETCGYYMHDHGWIDCEEEGVTVCPGHYVVEFMTGIIQTVSAEEFKDKFHRLI